MYSYLRHNALINSCEYSEKSRIRQKIKRKELNVRNDLTWDVLN